MVVAASLTAKVSTDGVETAKSKLQSLSGVVDSTQHGLANNLVSATKRASGSILDFGAKLGQSVIGFKGLYDAATGLGSALLSPNASMEQTATSFGTLLHSGEAAQKMMTDLKDFAATTPFEFPEIANSAKKMLAFGFSAEKIKPMLTNVGDAVSALGGGAFEIDRVTTAMGQMQAKGKVSAEEMMQLAEIGIPAWDMLAKGLGVTTSEAMSLSEKGLVPAGKAIDILTKGMGEAFGGGMQEQSKTFTGLLSTFKDTIMEGWRSFTGPLFEQAKGGLQTMGELVSSKAFKDFATGAGKQIGDVIKTIVDAIKSIDWGNFAGDFAYLGQQLGVAAPSGDQLKTAISGIGDVLKTIVTKIGDFARGLGDVVKWFKDGSAPAQTLEAALIGIGVGIAAVKIGAFLATLPALIGGFIAWGVAAWGAAAGVIAATWPLLLIIAIIALVVAAIILAVRNWGAISKWLTDTWQVVANWFGWFFGQIGAWFGGIGQWFTDRFNEAKNGVMGVWGAIGQWFNDRGTDIKNVFVGIGQWFTDRFNDAKNGVVNAFGAIGGWFRDRYNQITTAFSNIGGWFREKFTQAVDGVKNVFGGIGKWFQDRWTDIKNAFPNLYDAGKNIVQSLINGLAAMIENVKKKAGDIAQSIRNFFPHSPAKVGPLVDIDESMPAMGDIFAKGLNDQIGKLSKASFNVAAAINPMWPTGGYSLGAYSGNFTPASSQPVIHNHHHHHHYLDGKEITGKVMTTAMKEARSSGPIR